MVTLKHEFLVTLFRGRPALASELRRACAGVEVGSGTSELGSTDPGQVVLTEYRADAVVVIRDAAHDPVAAVIVEVQLASDPDQRWTWPLYVVALRAALKCPVTLFVLAPETLSRAGRANQSSSAIRTFACNRSRSRWPFATCTGAA